MTTSNPMTLAEQITEAQRIVASWPPEVRAAVRLEGRDLCAPERRHEITDAERWRYIRRKLCLTGNGDGTCAMQALNLPASIVGWPEPGEAADFCDAAIDAAILEERSRKE